MQSTADRRSLQSPQGLCRMIRVRSSRIRLHMRARSRDHLSRKLSNPAARTDLHPEMILIMWSVRQAEPEDPGRVYGSIAYSFVLRSFDLF